MVRSWLRSTPQALDIGHRRNIAHMSACPAPATVSSEQEFNAAITHVSCHTSSEGAVASLGQQEALAMRRTCEKGAPSLPGRTCHRNHVTATVAARCQRPPSTGRCHGAPWLERCCGAPCARSSTPRAYESHVHQSHAHAVACSPGGFNLWSAACLGVACHALTPSRAHAVTW